jgi:hypothetical protein
MTTEADVYAAINAAVAALRAVGTAPTLHEARSAAVVARDAVVNFCQVSEACEHKPGLWGTYNTILHEQGIERLVKEATNTKLAVRAAHESVATLNRREWLAETLDTLGDGHKALFELDHTVSVLYRDAMREADRARNVPVVNKSQDGER